MIIELRDVNKVYYKKSNKRKIFKDYLKFLFSNKKKINDKDVFFALKNINLKIFEGDRIGIIGLNGSGKSTLLKILSEKILPSSGQVLNKAKFHALLTIGGGFDKNLEAILNIDILLKLFNIPISKIEEKKKQIFDFAELDAYKNIALKNYSTGMQSRLSFSLYFNLNPDVLFLDEVLSVGDFKFKQKCFDAINNKINKNKTMILVSHNTAHLSLFADKCIWLENGQIRLMGNTKNVLDEYISSHTENKKQILTNHYANDTVKIDESYFSSIKLEKKNISDENELSFEIQLNTKKTIKNLLFNLNLFRDDGLFLFNLNSFNFFGKKIIIKEGKNYLKCKIDLSNISDGQYFINFVIHENTKYLFREKILFFKLSKKRKLDFNYENNKGIISLKSNIVLNS